MDCFVLLWMFDDRWLCRLRPAIHEQLLLGPIFINIVVLVATIYDRLQCDTARKGLLIDCMAVQAALLIMELAMFRRLVRARRNVRTSDKAERSKSAAYQHR